MKAKSLSDKITEGLNLAFEKLVKEKAKNDDVLIFSEKGKIIKVNAKDILKHK